MFFKIGVLKNFPKFIGKHLCRSLLFNKIDFIKKETPTQAYFCEFSDFKKQRFLDNFFDGCLLPICKYGVIYVRKERISHKNSNTRAWTKFAIILVHFIKNILEDPEAATGGVL